MSRQWLIATLFTAVGCSVADNGTHPPTAVEAAGDATTVEPGPPRDEGPVADPPMAFVGDASVPWTEFDAIFELKVAKYTARDRVPPESAVLRYRRSIATRLARLEQLRQAVGELGKDYEPTQLSILMSRQRQEIDDWTTHLQRRGETEESIEAMYIADLREELLIANLSMPPETPEDRAEIFEQLRAQNPTRVERVRVSRVFVPGSEGMERAQALSKAAAEKLGDMADRGRGEVGWSNTLIRADFLRPEVWTVAKDLPIGEVSAPVATDTGWEVMVVHARWEAGTELLLDEAAADIDARMPRHRLHRYLDQHHPVRWFINVTDASASARPTGPMLPMDTLPERSAL